MSEQNKRMDSTNTSTEVTNNVDSNNTSAKLAGELAANEQPVWKKIYDSASAKYYYVNAITKDTTWNAPPDYIEREKVQENIEQKEEETPKSETFPNKEESEKKEEQKDEPDNPNTKLQKEDNIYNSNWRTAIDHDSGRTYHYNMQTGQTQWANPRDIAQHTPTSGDYAFQNQITGRRRRRSMKEMQDAWDRGDRVGLWECPDCSKILTEGSKKTHPDSCNARKARSVHMVQGTPADILAGAHWRAVQDRNGQTYYYHQITKQTSWYKPTEMSNFEQYQQNQSIIQTTLGSRNVGYNQWTEVTDSNGRTYYYNNITGATSWTKPSGSQDEKVARPDSVGDYSAAGFDGQQSNVGEWVEVIDSSTGGKYYYNSVTKATSWTNPTQPMQQTGNEGGEPQEQFQNPQIPASEKTKETVPKENQRDNSTPSELENENSPNGSMPENANVGSGESPWREAFDKTTGRKYYYNELTNETNWEMPPELLGNEEEKSVENGNVSEEDGWKSVVDEKTGKTYFFNVVTKQTSWENPVKNETVGEQVDSEWIKIFDEKTERYYYHNPTTQVTTWSPPNNESERSVSESQVKNNENAIQETQNNEENGEENGTNQVSNES